MVQMCIEYFSMILANRDVSLIFASSAMCRDSSSLGYVSLKFGKSWRLRFHLFSASALMTRSTRSFVSAIGAPTPSIAALAPTRPRCTAPSLAASVSPRAVPFFFGIITTVGTVTEGAAGQRIPTVEGMQRLANRPRGRTRLAQVRTLLVSVGLKEPSDCANRVELACRSARKKASTPETLCSNRTTRERPYIKIRYEPGEAPGLPGVRRAVR